MIIQRVSARSPKGFTIVELLVVIVVIGILASITGVAFNGVQNSAHDASVQNDLRKVGKSLVNFQTINGRLPQGTADLSSIDVTLNKNSYSEGMLVATTYYNFVYCWETPANPGRFALVAESKSGAVFENVDGVISRASYDFTGGSGGVCSNAGIPLASGSARDWFYSSSAWMPYT